MPSGTYTSPDGLYKPAAGETGWDALADANMDILQAAIVDRHPKGHDHTAADGSGALTNEEHDGYSKYTQVADPSPPPSGSRYTYAASGDSGRKKIMRPDGTKADLEIAGDSPLVLGKADSRITVGLVRGDMRAFHTAAQGSDYYQALVDGLAAVDALYIADGSWQYSQQLAVPTKKILHGDFVCPSEDMNPHGTVLVYTGPTGAGTKAMALAAQAQAKGFCLDAYSVAVPDIALASTSSDKIRLSDLMVKGGATYAVKVDSCGQVNYRSVCFRPNPGSTTSVALYHKGADAECVQGRFSGGGLPLQIAGGYGQWDVLHVTGSPNNAANIEIDDVFNTLTNVYSDTEAHDGVCILVKGSWNRIIGIYARSTNAGYQGGDANVFVVDGSAGIAIGNEFSNYVTDKGTNGNGWRYLLKLIGSAANTAGTILGDGCARDVAELWNTRPAIVGNITKYGFSLAGAQVGATKLSKANSGLTASGDGANKRFLIPHGLAMTPNADHAAVSARSADAAGAFFVDVTDPPGTGPTLAQGAVGNVPTGVLEYAIAFVTNGAESVPGPRTQISVTTPSHVSLTAIPLGITGTTARKVYRTKLGTFGPLFLVGTISDNTTTTFDDNVAEASLGAESGGDLAVNYTTAPIAGASNVKLAARAEV